jgi:hypothetical protein
VKTGSGSKIKSPVIVAAIAFDVLTPMEMFSVGLYDYSNSGSTLLNISIVSRESLSIVAMSDQGKYYSSITDLPLV